MYFVFMFWLTFMSCLAARLRPLNSGRQKDAEREIPMSELIVSWRTLGKNVIW